VSVAPTLLNPHPGPKPWTSNQLKGADEDEGQRSKSKVEGTPNERQGESPDFSAPHCDLTSIDVEKFLPSGQC